MAKLRPMVPFLAVTALGLYLLPVFLKGSEMGLMLIVLPALVFICAVVYGITNRFHWIYPLIVSALFVPTVYIYYNESALIYTIIFGVIALAGSLLGRMVHAR